MNSSKLISCFTVTLLLTSCGKSADTSATDSVESNSNISESMTTEAGGQASAAEGASTPAIFSTESPRRDFVDPQDGVRAKSGEVNPLAICSFSSARSSCSSNADAISWGGCSVGLATLTGGWTETWSGGGTCPTAPATAGHAVTRTSTSQILTLASGATLTTDTNAQTTFDGTVLPATGTVVTSGGGSARTIVVNGVHRVFKGPLGRTWYDHSITSTGLTSNGTRAAGNRVITGTATTYHNLAKYKAVHTFNTVTWGSASCCYPTSGSISSVLTGTGRSGNVSITFSTSCGTATFTDTDSTTSTVVMNQCN